MKEKVILVCAGKVLARNLTAISSAFEIVTLADNNKAGEVIEGYHCIGIKEIQSYDFDKIIICSVQYEAVIREQLLGEGVEQTKIYDIGSLEKQLYYDKDVQKYKADKIAYIEACRNSGRKKFLYDAKDEFPVLSDYRDCAGSIDHHYFLTDIMMAREVIKRRPIQHFDIGSRVEGFISHLLVDGINTTVIDIRPLCEIDAGGGIEPLRFIQADAINLENIPDNSIESLSSVHSTEHFGLGRYGDSVDPEAYIKAMQSMVRVLKRGGYLYFAVPVGKKEKLCFNAHRIFSPLSVLEGFEKLNLEKMYLLHEMQFYEYNIEELRAGILSAHMIVGYISLERVCKVM